jgi:uncharacterized membrane protein
VGAKILKMILPAAFSLLAFSLLSALGSADVTYLGISTFIDSSGSSSVEVVATFEGPESNFTFDIVGRVENLAFTTTAGTVSCAASVRGISTVACEMSQTEGRKTIQVNFDSPDLVKELGNRFLFSADYATDALIRSMVVSVKLPEGMALVDEGNGQPGRLTFAQNATTLSDGRRISVNWELRDIETGSPLRFEIFYESLISPFWSQLRIRYFIAFGVVAAVVLAFLLMRRAKKEQELVVSVLDEYEKKVMDIVHAAGGTVNQKKVVQDLNLSKAKVSRIVKSLSERGVIQVERRGRTNILKEIKKTFGV